MAHLATMAHGSCTAHRSSGVFNRVDKLAIWDYSRVETGQSQVCLAMMLCHAYCKLSLGEFRLAIVIGQTEERPTEAVQCFTRADLELKHKAV